MARTMTIANTRSFYCSQIRSDLRTLFLSTPTEKQKVADSRQPTVSHFVGANPAVDR